MNNDTLNFQDARNLQWLFLAVASVAPALGKPFTRPLPYGLVLGVGAALNAASYLAPLKRLDTRRIELINIAQLTVSIAVVALAVGFSGGVTSPLYAFLLVTLMIPAFTASFYQTTAFSAYAILSFLLASALLDNSSMTVALISVEIVTLAIFPVAINILLSTYRRKFRHKEIFSTLYRISRSLGESLDIKQVLHRLLSEMDAVFGTNISSIRLLDPASNSLIVKISGAAAEEVSRGQIAIRMGEGFIGWVAKNGEPFITTDISKDSRFATFPDARKKVASAIAAPIQISNRTIGVISCASSTKRKFNADDLKLLVSVANLAAEAIERADLYQQLLSRGEAITESMADGLVIVNRECNVVLTNRAAREMLDARPGPVEPLDLLLKGKIVQWRQLCHDIRDRIIDCADEFSASFSTNLNITAGATDGRALNAHVSPITSQWGKVIGAIVLLEDISDIMRMASELALEKAKLETVLESVVVGVLAVDNNGEVLMANTTLFDMLDVARPRQWFRQSLEDAVGEHALVHLIREAIGGSEPLLKETIVLSSGRHIEVSCAPIKTLASQSGGVVAVLHDVTALRRVEQAKSDFVSMVSHELRTPLTSIKAYANTLQRKDTRFDNETRSSFIDIIAGEADQMAKLINDILDLSRIEAGRLDLKPTSVDFPKLVSKVITRIEPQTAGRDIVLDLPEGMGPVLAEPAKLEQVLLNLVINAMKYSPEGSNVTISAKRLEKTLMVSVSDRGAGIPEEQLPFIFDKYDRAGLSSTSDISGAGLGLYVTKSIVEAHGGRIWAESKKGEGTTVIFTMPLAPSGGRLPNASDLTGG